MATAGAGGLWIVKAGIVPYEDMWHLQGKLRDARCADRIGDTLLLLQHPPVMTFGRKAARENLLVPEETLRKKGIDCVATDRGGDVTYHCPGQLVGYPIIALRRRGLTIGTYVRKLEAGIIGVLRQLGIEAATKRGMVGVWVGERKIASIGTRVSKGVSTHGFALNVENDLAPFCYIHPCGMQGTKMTSVIKEAPESVNYRKVEDLVAAIFQRLFTGERYALDTLS